MGHKSFLILPVIAAGVLGTSALQASLSSWGPVDPTYQLVLQYRTDIHVLDHGLTQEDCAQALPFGDNVKQVHFACEREG
jgi:hypothetical protein